ERKVAKVDVEFGLWVMGEEPPANSVVAGILAPDLFCAASYGHACVSQRVALTSLAQQERAARVGFNTSGMSSQTGDQDYGCSVMVAGNCDAGGDRRASLRIEDGNGSITRRAQQRLCQPDRLIVRLSKDVFFLFHLGSDNLTKVVLLSADCAPLCKLA